MMTFDYRTGRHPVDADEIGLKFEKSRENFAYAERKRAFEQLPEKRFAPL